MAEHFPSATPGLSREVESLERFLGVSFPTAYRHFLQKRRTAAVGGHRILGLSRLHGLQPQIGLNSVLELTQLLRGLRPDLPQTLVAIGLEGRRALCLDTSRATEGHAPLVDVPLDGKGETLPVSDSFEAFIQKHETNSRDFQRELRRLRKRKQDFERKKDRVLSRLDRKEGKKQPTLSARPQDWHPRTIRAHDFIIALAAHKYNYRLGALEVDAFYVFDDPRYELYEPLRGLLIALFGDALHYGGTVDLAFTRDIREHGWQTQRDKSASEGGTRVPLPVPEAVCRFAKQYNVTFANAATGRITHEEGISLWWRLLRLPASADATALALESAGYGSRGQFATVISSGIWSREEAVWLLSNAPRPEAVLLGSDLPEHRPLFAESLEYGRAALLAARFARKVVTDVSGGIDPEEKRAPDHDLEPRGCGWKFRCSVGFKVPWKKFGEPLRLEKDEPLYLLARPVLPSSEENDLCWLAEQVRLLEESSADFKHLFLLLGKEFGEAAWIADVVNGLTNHGIRLLFAQQRLDLYDGEVTDRMARARSLRQFPERTAALKLNIIEVPESLLNSPILQAAMRDAETMARWIGKRVDVTRARREFTINCRTVERLILQEKECRVIAELDGTESLALLSALKQTVYKASVILPFVRPANVGTLQRSLDRQLRRRLTLESSKSGMIIIHVPFARPSAEPPLEPRQPPGGSVLPISVPIGPYDRENSVVGLLEEERRLASRIEGCLRSGEPLAVSYARHEVIPEILRHHLYATVRERDTITRRQVVRFDTMWCLLRALFGFPLYRTKEKVKKERYRVPAAPAPLRITYSDGTEGRPFPCYSLDPIERPSTKGFYKLSVGLVSMRHREVDGMVMRYLMRNRELQGQCANSAEQEQFAFERTTDFIAKLMKVVEGRDLRKIKSEDASFNVFVGLLNLKKARASGLELHVFQTTGFEPAIMGVWRAVAAALPEHRNRLIVVPRVLSPAAWRALREKVGNRKLTGFVREKHIAESDYVETQAWF